MAATCYSQTESYSTVLMENRDGGTLRVAFGVASPGEESSYHRFSSRFSGMSSSRSATEDSHEYVTFQTPSREPTFRYDGKRWQRSFESDDV